MGGMHGSRVLVATQSHSPPSLIYWTGLDGDETGRGWGLDGDGGWTGVGVVNTSVVLSLIFLSFSPSSFSLSGLVQVQLVDAPAATGPCRPDRFGLLRSGGRREAHV